jgi:hypothetical protein
MCGLMWTPWRWMSCGLSLRGGAVTAKLEALHGQQQQIEGALLALDTQARALAPTVHPTAGDLAALCQRMADLLTARDMAEQRTLLTALALTVVWHPEDHTLECWGVFPLATPTRFYWNGTTVHFHPYRHFTPGTPLPPLTAPLALPLLTAVG